VKKRWQFSLSWLLIQMCLLAFAMGCIRFVMLIGNDPKPMSQSTAALYFAAIGGAVIAWGALLGALTGRIWAVAIALLVLCGIWLIFLAPIIH
jgi:fatty acid desaturase